MTDAGAADPHPSPVARRPGRTGYAVAVLLLLAGIGVFLAAVLPGRARVHDAVAGLQRVVLPGGGTFTADGPGTVTLFYEKRSELDGQRYETAMLWDGTPLRVTDPAGRALEVTPIESMIVYRVPPFVAQSVGAVALPEAGTYTVEAVPDEVAQTPDGEAVTAEPSPRVIAIGRVPLELTQGGLRGIYGGAAVLGLAFTASVILVLITWARRHPVPRARGQLA